ncbi:hypothetical protein GCM10027049_23450 [Mucilaginibacter puniceus]
MLAVAVVQETDAVDVAAKIVNPLPALPEEANVVNGLSDCIAKDICVSVVVRDESFLHPVNSIVNAAARARPAK